jgi:TonB family protein
MDRRGITYSSILHVVLAVLLIFGLPSFFDEPEPHESAISVEILPMSELSNVKKKAVKPKPQPEKPLEQSKPVAAQPVAKPEEKKPEPTPEPKPEPKVEPKPEPVVKKPEPVKPKEQPKQERPKEKPKKEKPSELDSLLKTLEEPNNSKDTKEKKTKEAPQDDAEEENDKSDSSNYNDAQPLSMNEQDAIRSQVEKHWSPPAGAKDAGKMQVVLRVKVEKDGTITSVEVEKSSSGFGADAAVARAFDESSVRAVKMSSPLQHLPADKYDNWKDFTFTFTPEGI